MALAYPLDILANWPGWTTEFELLWRKEQSRQANGVTRTKDFGDPLWTTTATTKELGRAQLDYWRARLDALDGGDKTFIGYPLSRVYPMAYPRGSWPTGVSFSGTTAAVNNIGGDNKSLKISGLPNGFALAVGDMISVTYGTPSKFALFRLMEAATATSGTTGFFEVRPNLPVGIAISNVVSVYRPKCLMTVVPGSITSPSKDNGRGTVTFKAIEYR